ncbi:MAG TPA: hypothetical protein VFQ72_03385 [Candidatus Paceibacterota bacterium]|nr:hypothetical protein [Candidatus Paceibacterota bacterium]
MAEGFVFKASGAINKVSVKSAVNAALWLCGLISVPSFGAAIFCIELWLKIVFLAIGLIPVILSIVAYLYFMLTKPEYLRSEEFQIKKHFIDALGDKDHTLDKNAELLAGIANPLLLNTPENPHE